MDSERTSLNDRLKNAKGKLAEVTNQVDKSLQPPRVLACAQSLLAQDRRLR